MRTPMNVRERAYNLSVAAVGTLVTVFIIYVVLANAVEIRGAIARLIVGR